MRIEWNPVDLTAWRGLHGRAAGALQQHDAFGPAMAALGTQTVRACLSDDGGQVIGLAQFIIRRIAGVFVLALCSRGPVWAESVDAQTRREGYRLLARAFPLRHPRVVLFAPTATDDDAALRGMMRLVTGEAYVALDLTLAADELRAAMHAKWRNRLVAAEKAGLAVHKVGNRPAQYAWLLEREGLQRQQRAYRALPAPFVSAWQQAHDTPNEPPAARPSGRKPPRVEARAGAPASPALLTLRADADRKPVAAMMFLLHGSAASYHLGWSDATGRERSAHNLLLWHAMQELPALGIRTLELGAVNTQRGSDLARFKLGSGGRLVSLAGTFR